MYRTYKHIVAFFGWPVSEKTLFAEAVIAMFIAKAMLLLFPFKYCLHLLTTKNNSFQVTDDKNLLSIKKAIQRANRLAFWKNVCLVQSFTARWMLQRRDIYSQLSIGVSHDKNKNLIAHAWTKVNDFELVDKGLEYKELYCLDG